MTCSWKSGWQTEGPSLSMSDVSIHIIPFLLLICRNECRLSSVTYVKTFFRWMNGYHLFYLAWTYFHGFQDPKNRSERKQMQGCTIRFHESDFTWIYMIRMYIYIYILYKYVFVFVTCEDDFGVLRHQAPLVPIRDPHFLGGRGTTSPASPSRRESWRKIRTTWLPSRSPACTAWVPKKRAKSHLETGRMSGRVTLLWDHNSEVLNSRGMGFIW